MYSTAFFEHGQLFLNLSVPLKLDFQNPPDFCSQKLKKLS